MKLKITKICEWNKGHEETGGEFTLVGFNWLRVIMALKKPVGTFSIVASITRTGALKIRWSITFM